MSRRSIKGKQIAVEKITNQGVFYNCILYCLYSNSISIFGYPLIVSRSRISDMSDELI